MDTSNLKKRDTERDAEIAEGPPRSSSGVLYSVEDTPPWYLCIFLGFQVSKTILVAIWYSFFCCP